MCDVGMVFHRQMPLNPLSVRSHVKTHCNAVKREVQIMLILMGVRVEIIACTDPGARTPIGMSGYF